jgi:plastocyanin
LFAARITTVAIAAFVIAAPAGAQNTGRIDGSAVISRALASKRLRFRIYAEPGKGSAPPSAQATELRDEFRNLVIYLQSDKGGVLARQVSEQAKPATMAQRDEQFVPHVRPIMEGTTVEFPNEDDVFHNVFSLSSTKTFDLPKYPAGSSKSVTFPKTGIVNVFCHIHADMQATIMVRDNPFFVTPDTAGHFSLDGIPPGDYTIVAWHERIKPVTQKVKIVAGRSTPVSFNIPLPQPPER